MKHALQIFGFTILVSGFYWYVSLWVPQKRTDPPEDIVISASLTTDEMIPIGEEIVAGKGTCLTCHTMGESGTGLRFPDLGNIGAIAATRVEGQSDVDYLAESMYDPNAYVVEGFVAGMPNVSRPPIALTDQEILTVIAYLQSLGGTPTVTMDTPLKGQGTAPAPVATATGEADGATVFTNYGCNTCHTFDGTAGVGPSLQGLSERSTREEVIQSLREPDAVLVEGFAPGVMGATINAFGFADISDADFEALVDYLMEQ